MSIFWTIVVFAVVIGGALLTAWVLFELSPFAHHRDQYRDLRTGRKL
jgi:hypothetical protein